MALKKKKPIIKRKRGQSRPRHQTGRYSEIPVRVMARLFENHLPRLGEHGKCWMPNRPMKASGYVHVYWTDETGVDRTLTSQHAIGRVFHRRGYPLADDEVPHHKCVNAWCINPEHIEVIPRDDHHRLHAILRAARARRSRKAA